MIKINYFDERELLVRREIETKAPKGTEAKGTQVLPKLTYAKTTVQILTKIINFLMGLINQCPGHCLRNPRVEKLSWKYKVLLLTN